jgi:hypothetical protein
MSERAVAGTSVDKPEERDSPAKLAPEKQAEIAGRAACHFDVDYRR